MKTWLLTFILFSTALAAFGNQNDSIGYWLRSVQSVNEEQQVDLYNKLAEKYINRNPDSAVYFANLALQIIGASDHSGKMEAYKSLTKANYVLGHYHEAYSSSLKVIDLADSVSERKSLLFGQVYLGLTFMLQNRFRESIEVFNEYLELAKELKDSSSIARAYLDLSINYDAIELYDSALLYVNECIATSKLTANDYYLAMGYNRKGYILSDMGRYDSAVYFHVQCLEVTEEDNNWEKCFAYAGLAKAYSGAGNLDESLRYGKKSIALGKEMNAKWELKNTTRILSNVYAKKGDYENAYHYHTLFKSYHDSIFTEESEQRINALQLRQTRTERNILLRENKLQSKILEQKNTQLILTGILVVVLMALLTILYISINNRKKYIREIASQRDKLDELNTSKDQILSVLAHDMRSPLDSILQLIYLMRDQGVKGVDFDEALDEIHSRTSIVSTTLNNLLRWSMNQFKSNALDPKPVSISKLVEEQINLCSYDANKKHIEIIHRSETVSNAFAEEEQVKIIIRNLLTNAVKYSYENRSIEVSYRELDGRIALEVKDEGVGMSQAEIASLFESRGRSTRGTREETGTGFGLYICKEYAQLNQGDLTVASTKGKGSVFTLTLPKAKD